MDKGTYVAVSGSIAQERAMEIISNNLANLNTPGFKADRLLFESYLKKSMTPGSAILTPEQIRGGALSPGMEESVYLVASEGYTDFSQGPIRETSNPMDIALEGDGFLSVLTPDGEKFTRGGTFSIGSFGELVTKDGFTILNRENQPVFVNDKPFYIREDGTVTDVNNVTIGRLKVVTFADKSGLLKEGNNFYSAKDIESGVWSEAVVKQSYLEGSNINAVAEMTRMITVLRNYQAFQKAIHSQDEMTTRMITDVGRP